MIDIAEQLQNLLELKAMLRDAVAKESSPAALARYDDLLREVQDRNRWDSGNWSRRQVTLRS
jgi:hypothetical protein